MFIDDKLNKLQSHNEIRSNENSEKKEPTIFPGDKNLLSRVAYIANNLVERFF